MFSRFFFPLVIAVLFWAVPSYCAPAGQQADSLAASSLTGDELSPPKNSIGAESGNWGSSMKVVAPAFFGALFAFLFMWVWDAVSRHIERWNRHYSGVVRLGRATNEQIGALHNAAFEIAEILSAYRDARAEGGIVPMSANQPEEVSIDSSFELDLVNLDLVNDFASYRYNVNCINRDIRRLVMLKSNLELAYTEKRMSPEEFWMNLAFLESRLGLLKAYIDATTEEAITLTAKTRVRAKADVPWFHGVSMKLRKTRNEKDFAERAKKERTLLVGEIEQVASLSDERNRAIRGDHGGPGHAEEPSDSEV